MTMTILVFAFNFFKVIPFFLFAHVLGTIFGFFNPEYFTYESVAYGVLGNATYTMFQILQYLLSEEEAPKPLTKRKLYGLALRPLVAGLFSFILSAAIVACSTVFGDSIFGFITNSATALVIGLVSGLFFENLTKKAFLDKFFDTQIKGKILGK